MTRKESAYRLVRWEMGDGDVPLSTVVHHLPVLRVHVVGLDMPVRSTRDIVDLVLPAVSEVAALRDTLNEYLRLHGYKVITSIEPFQGVERDQGQGPRGQQADGTEEAARDQAVPGRQDDSGGVR